MPDIAPEIMTIGETAQYLRILRSSLYKLAQEGRIPCQKIGRHWRIRRQALEKWLEAFPVLHYPSFAPFEKENRPGKMI